MKQTLIGRVLSCLVTAHHICKQIGTKLLIADLYGHYGDDMVHKNCPKILELIEWHPGKDSDTEILAEI